MEDPVTEARKNCRYCKTAKARARGRLERFGKETLQNTETYQQLVKRVETACCTMHTEPLPPEAVIFEELPPVRQHHLDVPALLAVLRARPGEWARCGLSPRTITSKKWKDRYPGFEFTQRTVGEEKRVYARYAPKELPVLPATDTGLVTSPEKLRTKDQAPDDRHG